MSSKGREEGTSTRTSAKVAADTAILSSSLLDLIKEHVTNMGTVIAVSLYDISQSRCKKLCPNLLPLLGGCSSSLLAAGPPEFSLLMALLRRLASSFRDRPPSGLSSLRDPQ
jgi:hypothetical protein